MYISTMTDQKFQFNYNFKLILNHHSIVRILDLKKKELTTRAIIKINLYRYIKRVPDGTRTRNVQESRDRLFNIPISTEA